MVNYMGNVLQVIRNLILRDLGTPTAERPLEQLRSKSTDSRYLLSTTGPF